MTTPTTTPPTLQEASDVIAGKVRAMLVRRSRGELKRSADDFIHGLIEAWRTLHGLTDGDVALTCIWNLASDEEIAATAWYDKPAGAWERFDRQPISWARAEQLGLHVDLTKEES